jgi:hypothetical protein
MIPVYSVIAGRIFANGIRPVSVLEARRLMKLYADCAIRAVESLALKNPERCAATVRDDLALVAELKACIAAVEGFDPEPPANAMPAVAGAIHEHERAA